MITYNTIKQNVPISTVLRKYGFNAPVRDSYRIPCPLHGGRDANFSVSERNGLWNCFSVCQRGGSVIDLVAALEKISIKEAARKIDSDFNISPAQVSVAVARAFTNQVARYKNMTKDTIEIELPPHRTLEEGYRDLTRKTIEHWGLKRTDEGILIPLVNNTGKFCSYSVRRNDGKPKYQNAGGVSKCYPFGLYQNKQDIIDQGFVYLVEGQLDAVAMWQHGYKNVIAIMGSQISETQAMLLLAVTSTLMLVMDADLPGKHATQEIKKKWGSIFKIGHIDLPEGLDPDEYLLKGGKL